MQIETSLTIRVLLSKNMKCARMIRTIFFLIRIIVVILRGPSTYVSMMITPVFVPQRQLTAQNVNDKLNHGHSGVGGDPQTFVLRQEKSLLEPLLSFLLFFHLLFDLKQPFRHLSLMH